MPKVCITQLGMKGYLMRGILPLQGIIPLFGQLQHTESARRVYTLQQHWSLLLGPDSSSWRMTFELIAAEV